MDPVDKLTTGISNISLSSTLQTSSSIIPYYPEGTDFLTILTKELQKVQYTADPKFAKLTSNMIGKFHSTVPALGKGPNGHDIIKFDITSDGFYQLDVEYYITFTDNLYCREELPIRFKTTLKLPFQPLGPQSYTSFAIERRKRVTFLFSIAYRQYQYEKLRAGTTPLSPIQVKFQRLFLQVKPEECYRVKDIKALEEVRYPTDLTTPNEPKTSPTGFIIEGREYKPQITYVKDILKVKDRFPLSNACQVDLKNLHPSLEVHQYALLHQIYQTNLICEHSDTAVSYAHKIMNLFKDRAPATQSEIDLCKKTIVDISNEYSCYLKKIMPQETLSKLAESPLKILLLLLSKDFWGQSSEALHRVTPELFSGKTGHAESDYVVTNDYATNWGSTVSSSIRDGAGNLHISVSTITEGQWLHVCTPNSTYKSIVENEKTIKKYGKKLLKYQKSKLTDTIKKKIEIAEHILRNAYASDLALRKVFDDIVIHKQSLIPTCKFLYQSIHFIGTNEHTSSELRPPLNIISNNVTLDRMKERIEVIERKFGEFLKEYTILKSKLPAPTTPIVLSISATSTVH